MGDAVAEGGSRAAASSSSAEPGPPRGGGCGRRSGRRAGGRIPVPPLLGKCFGAREILKFLRDTKVEYMSTATAGYCEVSEGSVGLRRELGKIM